MIKLIIGLSRVLLIAALASGFTLYFTWTIVSTYVDKLMEQFNLPVQGQLVGFNDIVGAVTEDLGQVTGKKEEGKEPGEAAEDSAQADADEPPREIKDATPVFNQESEEELQGKELVFSSDDLAEKKDQLSNQDRQQIFSFLSALSAEELQKISELVEGGVTEEEMVTIQEMVEKSIAPEEFRKLMEILEKY